MNITSSIYPYSGGSESRRLYSEYYNHRQLCNYICREWHCLFPGSGSGVVTNSTFMISNADIDPSMGAVVNGILVILDSTEIFDPRDVVDVTCFNGSNIVTAIAFLIGELLIIMRG